MILRDLKEFVVDEETEEDSAWHLVEQSQRLAAPPMLLIPQPAHAVLAGELAKALLPAAFGMLPASVLAAIRMHDTGWGTSDAEQINRVRNPSTQQGRQPMPAKVFSFVAVPSTEAVEAWTSSVDEVEKIAAEAGYIVSQHFSLLASGADRAHAAFLKKEKARQERLTKVAKASREDLERWTDVLGFCDLLSLYLCCGATAAATLPRCHPSRPDSAAMIHVRLEGESLFLSEPMIRQGTVVEVHGIRHPRPPFGTAAQRVNWRFS